MANCINCGRELPSFSVGDVSSLCADCRRQATVTAPPEQRRLTTLELARMFPVTSALIAINVVIYVLCSLATMRAHVGSPMDFDTSLLLKWGADFGPLTLDREWWRLFTSMFLHGGLLHVAANMWCLWALGLTAERMYGRYRYLAVYLLTGLGSSVASLALHPATVSVGASGAIFGVVGALVFPFYRKRVTLPGPVMKSMMRSLGTFIIVNLAIGQAIPVIDNAAHVGGLLVGLAIGAIITHLAVSGADLQSVFPKVAIGALVLIALAFGGVQHWRRDMILPQQAYTWADVGDLGKAQASARRAVDRNPKSALAHVALGDVLYLRGQFQDAVKEYETTHALEPNDGYAAGRLGLGYVATGNMEAAEPLLRQGVKDDPDDASLTESLGIALAGQGKFDEAAKALSLSLQKNPKSARAHYALGSVLLDQGKYQEALGHLREAVRLKPDNSEYKKTLAEAEGAVLVK